MRQNGFSIGFLEIVFWQFYSSTPLPAKSPVLVTSNSRADSDFFQNSIFLYRLERQNGGKGYCRALADIPTDKVKSSITVYNVSIRLLQHTHIPFSLSASLREAFWLVD